MTVVLVVIGQIGSLVAISASVTSLTTIAAKMRGSAGLKRGGRH